MTEATLTPDLVQFIREQKDRQEIWDCLLRYTRGVDRHDHALMVSAYHPDAYDEHGVAEGLADDFCKWAIGWHGEFQTKHQHIITNHTVELDGDTAHGETYYIFWGENRQGPPQLSFGRYIDRFERHNGEWRIFARVATADWWTRVPINSLPLHDNLDPSILNRGRRGADDPYYSARASLFAPAGAR